MTQLLFLQIDEEYLKDHKSRGKNNEHWELASKDGFKKEEGSENENAPSRNDNNQIPYVIGKFHKKFKHNINRSMKEIQKKTCIR